MGQVCGESGVGGKIWQHLAATIGCRFGGWKKAGNYKCFCAKTLGAVCHIATGRQGVANSSVSVAT